ncbi:MAG TPA: CoB--CoM heterodisulfide reductase iron-sulfur subunit A family protein [Dehalococcoidia bacterium]|nr:CoB--CoM heterodisulfide reductase iron-sulfur subunit A family protein [Dehalococcoidia bacterium]
MAKGKRAPGVLVIGAGIAGIKAALELAEFGVRVYLCDHKPYIGGTLSQLDRWFPDNHCGMCKVLPVFDRDRSSQYCLRQGLIHPDIEILPLTEVEKVEGEAGDFRVTLSTKSSWVKPELCTGCGLCAQVCPVEVDSEFNQGLEKQKAIHSRHPLALPRTYTIDQEHCTQCGACVDACPTGAIDLASTDEIRDVAAGAIILATGFEEFDPLSASQYGYKRYPNVITSIELERLLSKSGPSGGKLVRPSDGQVPRSVAFLQCVGSRDLKRNYCSSACCMYALKEAMMIKEAEPETNVAVFFMDLRAFGKGYHRYYEQARRELGVQFTRARIPVVKQDFKTEDLLLTTVAEDGKTITSRFDLVVLSVGQTPSPRFREISEVLGLTTNQWGFGNTEALSPVVTSREGIFACGSAAGPKDIADTLVEAEAAAGKAVALVKPAKQRSVETEPEEDEEPKIAVFVCNCQGQIADAVDTKGLLEFSKGLAGVVHAEEAGHLCQPEVWSAIPDSLKKSGANRLVVAACSALRPGILSLDVPVELVNIREELAWVHQGNSQAAAEKGKSQIAMAVEKLGRPGKRPSRSEEITTRAVIVGGGLGGLVAALSLAEYGLEVELVEKSAKLGGNLTHIHSLLEGGDPQGYLHHLVEKVNAEPLIHVWIETELVECQGYAGNFQCTLRDGDSAQHDIEAGAIIIAAGGVESRPAEYLYGQAEPVITQRELDERLAGGALNAQDLKCVVMIQCVGSRDEERPYCSRVCCSQALKNALALKRQNPDIDIVVFYRDLMSYGFKEEYYTQAREAGVLFVRYEVDRKPTVTLDGEMLKVQAADLVLGGDIIVEPDLVVLSPAIVPNGSGGLAHIFGIELTEDGFFKEAESKFRPVDTLKEGIFVCGLAHSPRGVSETIAQAQAAAQQTAWLLSRARLAPSRLISQVNERRCSGCELCIAACPYDARFKDSEKGVVVVRPALCQGCGACVVACPNAAASLTELEDRQIFSMMDVVL